MLKPPFVPAQAHRAALASLSLLLMLGGCGGGETPSPAGLARNEEQALNDAAEMLDETNNGTQSE